MLVLVSFGLVLLATILLVVGLLSDDGLTLIYLSIAASATAAVVLSVAFRRARAKAESAPVAARPAPLAADLVPELRAEEATAAIPTASPAVDGDPTPDPAPVTKPAPLVVPVPVASDDDWMADADWEGGEVDFPIADYDDLTVTEVLPLLPQLYSDELDVVIERERSGKNRPVVVDRLEELKVVGTEADAEEFGTPPAESAEPAEPLVSAGAPAAATSAAAPGRASRRPSLLDLGDEDLGDELFPIAGYDDLTVAQIMPLLRQLESDELDEVRDREVRGANRETILEEIDRKLG